MKKCLFSLFSLLLLCTLNLSAQLNVSFAGSLEYDNELNDIWGYVAPDGTEYAIVGVFNGVSIVSLADPTNPTELFFIPGAGSTWRDIKTWDGFAYVTNETANGLAVIDLTGLPNTIDSFDWTPNIFGLGQLSSIHNIYIDEFGYAYLAGSNINEGGVLYIDVFSDPGNPIYAGAGPAVYSHDVYTRDNKMYSSEIYEGSFAIYDVSDKTNTVYLGGANTLSNFTHNAWLSDDSNYLFTTDEVANGTVGSFDVSDPSDVIELDQFYPFETLGEGVIPHNVHVWNDWVIISYYTDGCIIVDASNPSNLIEVGNFDTFIPENTGFSGAWGAYPFLPSGLILISDIEGGLFVLEPNYVRACWLEGTITDAETGDPINEATIKIVDTNVFDASSFSGDYATGYAIAGTYEIEVSKIGYVSKTVSADLMNDETTELDVALEPLPSFSFSGSVIEKGTGLVVPFAKVIIENDVYKFEADTDDFGGFTVPQFYEDEYSISIGKWGYTSPVDYVLTASPDNNTLIIEIDKGYEDIFSLDLGWEISGDNNTGTWELGAPIGVNGNAADLLTPDMDIAEDAGNSCYVTGNTSDFFDGVVRGGTTRITSPKFDVEDYVEPKLSFYYWYFNVNINSGEADPNYTMRVTIANGTDEITEDITFENFDDLGWIYYELDLTEDLISPTDDMTVSIAVEGSNGFNVIAEGAVDYFRVWDNAAPEEPEFPANIATLNNVDFTVAPNPSENLFTVNYNFNKIATMPVLRVYNTLGQFVQSIALDNSNGSVQFGEALSNGIYYVQIADGFKVSKSLKVVKN